LIFFLKLFSFIFWVNETNRMCLSYVGGAHCQLPLETGLNSACFPNVGYILRFVWESSLKTLTQLYRIYFFLFLLIFFQTNYWVKLY
jgi:hypothetical protein